MGEIPTDIDSQAQEYESRVQKGHDLVAVPELADVFNATLQHISMDDKDNQGDS